MKIREITDVIEQFAPLALQESYDNSGLVVGRHDDELRGGVLIAVDVTHEVIEEAIALGCGLIITHHPIIFHPLKRLNSASVVERCVEQAIKHDIALYACHTNLDAAPGGMSWRLGEILGVRDMQVLEPSADGVGFGTIGTLAEPMPVQQFLGLLRERLDCGVVRHSELCSECVSRVAICTGAGGSCIEAARAAKCDIYVTADVRYNDFFAPAGEFVIADVGHFESEFCAIQILFDILSKNFTNFALHKSACSQNPVHYFV